MAKDSLQDAARLQRKMRPSRKAIVVASLALLALIPIAGLIYEAYADGTAGLEFEAPGRRVDIGGRSLHLLCIGEGEPTVVFESSGWGTSVSSAAVRERLAGQTTVCSYDRAGNGWSDPGPSQASAADLARDLAVLQDRAQVRWPAIMVASSIGGLTTEMFARQYPERVAGLVFVDAANSEWLSQVGDLDGRARRVLCTASMLGHFGILRLVDPFNLNDAAELRQAAALTYSPRPWGQLCAMARAAARTKEEFASAPPLPADLPLVVLSASSAEGLVPPGGERWIDPSAAYDALQASHKRLAMQSTRGQWLLVPDSPHLIAERHPDIVSEVILGLVGSL